MNKEEVKQYKDFFGNEVNIGDEVAFMETKYRSLMIGTVVRITDKMVIINHDELSNKNCKSETKQYHSQTIKKLNKLL